MKWEIKKYCSKDSVKWDQLIKNSSNGTFLHLRNYMDYHQHLFEDFSLMIYKDTQLVGVLPAHKKANQIFSHNGLTYGDFIFKNHLRSEYKAEIIKNSFYYFQKLGFQEIFIKSIPSVFQSIPNEINIYLFDQFNGKREKILPFFVIDKISFRLNSDRKKSIKKLKNTAVHFKKEPDKIDEFWEIVELNLWEKYKTKPVHSLKEIQLLMERFPKKIQLYTAEINQQIISGALIFIINKTLHFQYIHSITDKKLRWAVDCLTEHIIRENINKFQYISLGSSEKEEGLLNKNLVYWKESFGAYISNQYFYKFDLSKWQANKEIFL